MRGQAGWRRPGRRTPGCRGSRTSTPTGSLNEALDGAGGPDAGGRPTGRPAGRAGRARTGAGRPGAAPTRGWSAGPAPPTTLVLVRHGVTAHTVDKRFSGGLGGSNPGLTDEGRAQVRATADWLAPLAERDRRGRLLAGAPHPRVRRDPRRARLGRPLVDRGRPRRDGVRHLGRADLRGDPGAPPRRAGRLARLARPRARRRRVVPRSSRSGCWPASTGCSRSTPAGRSLVVSHVTPIKVLVAHALGAPLESVYRMEMAPASVTVLSFFDRRSDGRDADVQRAPDRRGVVTAR